MFDCSKCGACCRHIAKVLPHYDKGDGTCLHLTEDNLCAVYDHRPFICKVDEIYNSCFRGRMTQEEFYKITKEACKILQELEV